MPQLSQHSFRKHLHAVGLLQTTNRITGFPRPCEPVMVYLLFFHVFLHSHSVCLVCGYSMTVYTTHYTWTNKHLWKHIIIYSLRNWQMCAIWTITIHNVGLRTFEDVFYVFILNDVDSGMVLLLTIKWTHSDQAHHRCVATEIDDGIGVKSGYTVVCVWGVQQEAQPWGATLLRMRVDELCLPILTTWDLPIRKWRNHLHSKVSQVLELCDKPGGDHSVKFWTVVSEQ